MSKTIGRSIIALTACVLISACGQTNTPAPAAAVTPAAITVTGISFSNTPAPSDQYAAGTANAALNMSKPYTTSVATVTFSDNTQKQYPLEHKMLFRSDDVIQTGPHAGEYYGGIVDQGGVPVMDPVAANNTPFYATVTGRAVAAGLAVANKDQLVSDTPDGAALIKIPGAPATAATADLSYLNHFEYVTWDGNRASQYGKNPMFIGNSTLSQDLTTGLLSLKRFDKLTFSLEKGLWIPCAASKSPWNTFIGSEEYEPDQHNFDMNKLNGTALDFSNGNLKIAFQQKFGNRTARPYDYGFVTETTVNQAGAATTVKHYATGRWARELIKMMPDGKTYYSGDDGKSTVLFMGVADTPNDLSAVTLYASKFTQTSPKSTVANKAPGETSAVAGAELGAGTLKWIRLGHATDATIKSLYIDTGTKSTDIFDIVLETSAGVLPATVTGVTGTGTGGAVTAANMTAAGYKRVFNYYHRHTKGKAEWLRLKSGMSQAAAFLETRRYAAYLGATSEWTKMEGVALNAADKKVYIAISYQYDSMVDGVGDIQMGLLTAGNTYALSLAANISDTTGTAINSAWVATSLAAIPQLKGLDNTYTAAPHKRKVDAQGNLCKTGNVANPDNLKFSAAYRTLFIGEDSNCHVNNFVWAFNVDTGTKSRILSLPLGSEATGLMAVDNINGFAYIGSNYQHPGDVGVGKPPVGMVTAVETANPKFAEERNRSGGIGYLHFKGMPRM